MRTNLPLLALALTAAAGCSEHTNGPASTLEMGSLDLALTVDSVYVIDAVDLTADA